MASTHTLTGNIYDLTGATLGNATNLRVTVVTNLPAKEALIDKTTNSIHLGGKQATVNATTGEFTIDLIDTSATDLNVPANTLQYEVRATYINTGGNPGQQRASWESGWFSLTADVNLADVATDTTPLAVTSASQYALEAKGYRDETAAISGLTGEDAAVAFLVGDTGSATAGALSATIVAGARAPRIHHLDTYNRFFGGGKWITGQSNAATTLAAAVAAGASVLPVASASLIVAGQQLVVAEGTAQQKIYTVASVASNDVTINGTVTYALANGATVTPLWTNSSHLTLAGYRALAYFIANATTNTGEYVITGTTPKVTFLGNSWISQGGTVYGDELDDRIPGATSVNAGVSGDTSAMLLARFDTDVPADSDYVVFNEPGVNDDSGYVSPATQAAQYQRLVEKIFAIGAVPVYAGHVPLADLPGYSAARASRTTSILGSDGALGSSGLGGDLGTSYAPEADSVGLGTGALYKVTTATQNTALGVRAGAALTTGNSNTLVGREAGTALTTGINNVGIGQNVLRALVTGSNNVAIGAACLSSATGAENTGIGQNTLVLATTGTGNTAFGKDAGYNVNGSAAKATTTASYQTAVGYRSGCSPTNSYATAIGALAEAGGAYATALGSAAAAIHTGAVAIGRDASGTGAASNANNDFVLGTVNHRYRMPGLPTVAPTAGSGILWNDAGVVKVA